MLVQLWQTLLRRQAAEKGDFAVSEVSDRWSPGQYNVTGPQSRRSYRVVYHGRGNEWNHCDCMDFRTNSLGTCKHIEAVALWLDSQGRKVQHYTPRRSAIYMAYPGGRRLKLYLTPQAPKELTVMAMKYFDDDMTAVDGLVADLPDFISHARKTDPQFVCHNDALNYILEERDRRARREAIGTLSDSDVAGILHTSLYPYQIEGIRKAFAAGRCLIADEMGLGKTVQALATAELMKRQNMVGSVIIVCPTSLKYQWKKEIERFTDSTVTVVEGPGKKRADMYLDDSFYKIVSYHTLAKDIRTVGGLKYDFMIMDEVQRLKNWNTQISQAARRVDADYAVVLSGTPLENKIEELYSVVQFVDQYALGPYFDFMDRYVVRGSTGKVTGYRRLGEVAQRISHVLVRRRKAEVGLQLPGRTDKTLLVPMTREQRDVHDQCQSAVARLVYKWQRHKFLSEKDRKRLLLLLSQMRMVCDSTFVLDQKSRYDTKVDETVQLITAMIEGTDGKAVVFSQWERMTRIVTEELDRAGIPYLYLHGGVPGHRRGVLVDAFATDPAIRVFVSTDAGATGLNLQAASLVINLDLPWNPAVLEQRIGRIHRLGQQNNIQVINMIAAGTIEERMLSTLDFKSKLFEGILDGGSDNITLDDTRLTRVVEAIADVLPDESQLSAQAEWTGWSEPPESPENVPAPEDVPAPEAVLRSMSDALGSLARTLQSPEATERLLDTIVATDADGNTELRIPVPDRDTVRSIATLITKLFAK